MSASIWNRPAASGMRAVSMSFTAYEASIETWRASQTSPMLPLPMGRSSA